MSPSIRRRLAVAVALSILAACSGKGTDSAGAGGGPETAAGSGAPGATTTAAGVGSGHPTGATSGTGGATGGTGGTGAATSGTSGTTTSSATTGSGGNQGGVGPAALVAKKLGRPTQFLIGVGNDLTNNQAMDPAFLLGVPLDLHYAYLVGLQGQGGWPDWNPNGTFVDLLASTAAAKNVVPMFTLYQMAAQGENNLSVLTSDGYMQPYWDGVKLLFQRLAAFGKPAVVHFEPDWWGYAELGSPGGDPTKLPVHVASLAPDCAGLPDDVTGMGKCLVAIAHATAPLAVVGFHASVWAGTPAQIVTFLNAVGAGEADFVATDLLDRDAGCYEAHTDPNCQRNDGPWYWDETNQTTPNFTQHLTWAQTITSGLGKPMLWWQVPFGVPSATPGGSAGHYRDNRVHYLFAHPDEFIAAGGLGAAFGTGAANQTFIGTDGGQFQTAVNAYYASPAALP